MQNPDTVRAGSRQEFSGQRVPCECWTVSAWFGEASILLVLGDLGWVLGGEPTLSVLEGLVSVRRGLGTRRSWPGWTAVSAGRTGLGLGLRGPVWVSAGRSGLGLGWDLRAARALRVLGGLISWWRGLQGSAVPAGVGGEHLHVLGGLG